MRFGINIIPIVYNSMQIVLKSSILFKYYSLVILSTFINFENMVGNKVNKIIQMHIFIKNVNIDLEEK